MHKISIVVPVHNEREVIKDFIINLKEVMQKNDILSECIIVDDNSNDGTQDILKRSDVTLLIQNRRSGYGSSLKAGINKANGDVICIIDGDNTYYPGDIQLLAQFIDKYDMVVGARIKEAAQNFPFYQKIAKGLICSLLRVVFRQKILDINSGLRLMRKDVVKKYLSILPDGFSFTASITLAMLLNNNKIKYVPISYSKRAQRSKVRIFKYTINFIRSCCRIIYHSFIINKI